MRVLLISANTEEINMPALPLGLACVAAATRKAGHDVAMVDLMAEKDVASILKGAIDEICPDVIGISVRNIDDQNMEPCRFLLDPVKEIVTGCRSLSRAKIVLGGAGYSIFPERALAFLGADLGIQGEGEVVFPQLIERIETGADFSGLSGLYLAGSGRGRERSFAARLDPLLLPGTDLWPVAQKREDLWMPVQTRRGCPLSCSYCSTEAIEGRLIRRRSPEAIVQWMSRWVKAGIHRFYFVDNIFNLPPSYAKEICRQLIDHDLKIKWQSILYPKHVDEELVGLMARAGCEQVSLGFESGSPRILRNMNKRFAPEEVLEISRMLDGHGIRQMGFLLLGGPGETRESVEEGVAFTDSLNLDVLKITAGVRIYPRTLLSEKAVGNGVISPDDDLLFPRFYLERGLEDWLIEALKDWAATRPHWKVPDFG